MDLGLLFLLMGEAIESALPATLRRGKTKMGQRLSAPDTVYEPSFDLKLTVQQKRPLSPYWRT